MIQIRAVEGRPSPSKGHAATYEFRTIADDEASEAGYVVATTAPPTGRTAVRLEERASLQCERGPAPEDRDRGPHKFSWGERNSPTDHLQYRTGACVMA